MLFSARQVTNATADLTVVACQVGLLRREAQLSAGAQGSQRQSYFHPGWPNQQLIQTTSQADPRRNSNAVLYGFDNTNWAPLML
jgi:hypothetical protein